MGRIETPGQVLVDLKETIQILGKSRATVFRLLATGELIRVPVRGKHTLYVTMDSIERCKNPPAPVPKVVASSEGTYYPNETEEERAQLQREVKKRFPHIFRPRRDLLQVPLPFPDPPLSSAE